MAIRDSIRKDVEREGGPSAVRTALAHYASELNRTSGDSLEAKALIKLCFLTNKELNFICESRFEESLAQTGGRELASLAEEFSNWVIQEVWAQCHK